MMSSPRTRQLSMSVSFVLALGALASVACDGSSTLDAAPMTNDLRAPGNAPVPGPNNARGGAADDTIKPAPTVNNARGGVPDDTIKPAPTVNVAKVGTADDGVKPAPTVNVAKVGTADDGVKPAQPGTTGGTKPSTTPKSLTPKPAGSTP